MRTKVVHYRDGHRLIAEREMVEFFGRAAQGLRGIQAVFTNEVAFALAKDAPELIVFTTELAPADLSGLSVCESLCLVLVEKAMKTQQWAYARFRENAAALALMKEYSAIPLYTGVLKKPQSAVLDQSDPFKFPRIAFVYYADEPPDLQSYEAMGFRFVAIARKGIANDNTTV